MLKLAAPADMIRTTDMVLSVDTGPQADPLSYPKRFIVMELDPLK